ncbi:hypothetical protein EON83_10905 [bacterium]|nr:MAG: hypothetical protein EON83_10905 [bacterium]
MTNLRLEIPRDATPDELADVALALLSEPDVFAAFEAGVPIIEEEAPAFADHITAFDTSPEPTAPSWWGKALGILSKAIRPGGPAHAGLSIEEVEAKQSAAFPALRDLQDGLVHDLESNLDGWDAALQLARAGDATGQLSLDGALDLQERVWRIVERDARSVLREAYREAWMRGREAAGVHSPMRADEKRQLEKMYRAQQNYFLNLLKDKEHGTGKMPFPQRIAMYGAALRAAFYAGQVLADLSGDVFYQWTLGAQEHCSDCLKLARSGRWRSGVYSAKELSRIGVFPGSGDTQCVTKCGCTLHRCARPKEKPKGGALASLDLIGPHGNSFAGNGRFGRTALANAVARYGWTHKGKR